MVVGSNLRWQSIKKRKCTPKGQAWYVNVQGSVHWKGVYSVGIETWGCKNFLIGF